jgi:glucosamine 6-phosphate synthetase-like amidotransferase/phosphosugar isomerase protein
MCGIIYVKHKTSSLSPKVILRRYERQRTRGTDGFGYVAIRDGTLCSEQRATTEREIVAKLHGEQAAEVLFHHRLPTSTPNFVEATHPIVVNHPDLRYRYYVVHNGIISNAEELRARHEQEGFQYTTAIRKEWITRSTTYYQDMFNDSEALAVEVARYLEGKSQTIAAEGSIACIMLQVEKQTQRVRGLHYGRNEGSPLIVHETADVLSITSEGHHTYERVPPHVLRSYDYATHVWTERSVEIGTYTPNYCSAGVSLSQSENDFTYDESDMLWELEEERRYYEQELRKARVRGDWEQEQEIEATLASLRQAERNVNTYGFAY